MSRGYLLDTNVISELAKPRPEPAVVEWLQSVDVREQRLSVITIYEITTGIARLKSRDYNRYLKLREWFGPLTHEFFDDDRTVDVTQEIAWLAGELQVPNPRQTEDVLIAASAIVEELVVVTRNVRHFQYPDLEEPLEVFNPWDAAAER